jgi:YD repeat-containing protein
LLSQFYDKQNRVGLTVSAGGYVTQYCYDRQHNTDCTIKYANKIDVTKLGKQPNGDLVLYYLKKNNQTDRYQYTCYDDSHRKYATVDAKGYLTLYTYDSLDRLIQQVAYVDAVSSDELSTLKQGNTISRHVDLTKDRCTNYYYDSDNLKIGMVDSNGWVIAWHYDYAKRLTEKIQYATPITGNRASDFTNVIPDTTTADAHTYHFYDARDNCILTVDAKGYITTFDYYPNATLKTKTQYYTTVDSTWYNDTTKTPTIPKSNTEDRIHHYVYDKLARQINAYDENGLGQKTAYDSMGQVTLKQSYDYTSVNDQDSDIDSDKTRTQQYQYDDWQQCAREANPFITQQFADIDHDDSLSKEEKEAKKNTLWENNSQRKTYDASGLTLTSTNTLNHQRIYYYDIDRRLVLSIDARGAATQFSYNAFNQVISTHRYVTLIDQTALNTLTGGFINNNVLKLLISNDDDVIDKTTYDLRGQKSTTIDAESFQTTYSYNAFLELNTQTKPLDNTKPSLMVQYTYNLRGQCIQTTSKNGNLSVVTQKSYLNCYGKITKSIDAKGNTTTYTYDNLGNQQSITDANAVTIVTKTYDAFSRVLTKTDAFNQTTTYTYNQINKNCLIAPPIKDTQSTHTYNVFGERVKTVDALNNIQTWQHAPDGQVTLWVDQLNRQTQHQFNTESQPILIIDSLNIQKTLRYNEAGVLYQSIDDSKGRQLTSTYTLDALNRRSTITNPRGFIKKQTFDRRSLCIQTISDYGTDKKPGFRLVSQHTYNGQHTRTSTMQGDTQVVNQYSVQFHQDALNRSIGKVVDPETEEDTEVLALEQRHYLNANGSIIAYVDPKNYIRRHFYDACQNHRFTVDADGTVTQWQYDKMHRNTCVYHYAVPVDLNSLSNDSTIDDLERLLVTSTADNVTYLFYDENNRQRFQVKLWQATSTSTPRGIVTETGYDNCSRKNITINYITTIDASNITSLTYTALVKQMAQKHSDDDRIIYHVHDAAGQLRFQFDPLGGVIFDASMVVI